MIDNPDFEEGAEGWRMRATVRLINGRLWVTRSASYPGEPVEQRTRPLTRWERFLWRLLQRTPNP